MYYLFNYCTFGVDSSNALEIQVQSYVKSNWSITQYDFFDK